MAAHFGGAFVLVALGLFLAAERGLGSRQGSGLLGSLVATVAALVLATAWAAWRAPMGAADLGLVRERPGLALWVGAVAGAVGAGLVGGWAAEVLAAPLLRALGRSPDSATMALVEAALREASGPALAALVVLGALAAPAAEEVAFRGLLFRAALGVGPRTALVATSVGFAAFHLDPAQALGVVPIAFALGFVRSRSQGLGPAVLAHAANNALALGALGSEAGEPGLGSLVVGVALTGVGLVVVGRAAGVESFTSGPVRPAGEDR